MNTRLITFIALLSMSIPGIGVDLYAPSLPAIATELGASVAVTKMTISTYLLGYAAGQISFGTLSDVYGRRPVLLFGVLLFVIASLVGSFAPTIAVLLAVRVVQGFSAAAGSVISKTLLTDTMQGKKLAVNTSYVVMAWGIGLIIGPVIGGYLQHYFGWRANFIFYFGYSAMAFLTIFFLLQETNLHRVTLQFHSIVKNYGQVMINKIFISGVLILGFGYSLIIVFNIAGPFLIQNVLGYSAVVYGHVALFVGAAFLTGILSNRFLIQFIDVHKVINLGLLLMLLVVSIMVIVAYTLPLSLINIAVPIFMIIATSGLVFPNCMAKCLSFFPHISGIASAAMGSVLYFITMVTSLIISLLKGTSLVPAAWSLTILVLLQALIYWIFISGKRKQFVRRG